MTIKEKLLQEFGAAINAEFGSYGDNEWEDGMVSGAEIEDVAHKVKFYLDL